MKVPLQAPVIDYGPDNMSHDYLPVPFVFFRKEENFWIALLSGVCTTDILSEVHRLSPPGACPTAVTLPCSVTTKGLLKMET